MAAFDPDAEWLEADGLGGYAMGRVGLSRTRRYHALLCTAATPPTGRRVLVAGADALLEIGDRTLPLSAQRYLPDVVHPRGDQLVTAFAADPWPSWEFALPGGPVVQHELFVVRASGAEDRPAVVLCWRLRQPVGDITALLTVRPLLAGRDQHALRRERDGLPLQTLEAAGGVRWRLGDGDCPDVMALANGDYRRDQYWYRDFHYPEEQARGYDAVEDLLAPGVFTFDLRRGAAWLVLQAGAAPAALPTGAPIAAAAEALARLERARRAALPTPLPISVHRAAESYVVARGQGRTLIAGYPWFTDWGRDTFIALRGLALAIGRRDVAREILCEWAGHVSEGMLPNRFPDDGAAPEYHSVDAALWFVVAAHEYLAGGDVAAPDRVRLQQAVLQIVAGYAAGTRHRIAMTADGLLAAGEPGVQLTWMDAIVAGQVVTPRIGKPVEIQALWLNALWIAAGLDDRWRAPAARGEAAFAARFWNDAQRCLYDVVDADHRAGAVDPSVRCNQILAVGGLPRALLAGDRARAVVDCVERELWTPLGLRTLAPGSAGYCARYEGGPAARDRAYHNGTAWPWLLGPFVEAWMRVRGGSVPAIAEARARFVQPLRAHLQRAGLGHVSEIADAEPPHTPRGCPFQAWSLGELLRLEFSVLAAGGAP